MKIAVTGSSGYVGGLIASGLEQDKHKILNWSRRKRGNNWHFFDLSEDPNSLPWDGVEGIVHAAHDFTSKNWRENLSKNVVPSIRLLETAALNGVNKIVFISSISSYDGTRSDYGRAKYRIEEKVIELGGIVIRPGLVWGANSGGVMGAIESLTSRLPVLPCLSGPDGLGQFLVHQDDLRALVCCLFNTAIKRGPHMFEAAFPEPVPLLEIVATLSRRTGRYKPIIPLPWQLALFALKTAEILHIPISFRSDSLIGLVYRIPKLHNPEATSTLCNFRKFTH